MAGSSWSRDNPGKAKFLVFLGCVIAFELAVRFCVWLDWLPYTRYPTSLELKFWTRSEPVVGIWHQPEARFVDDRRCFDATYESNSMGARDRERQPGLPGEPRVIVLGDSLIEGLGVAYGQRLTELLERDTGIEHMNIASSDWSTIQQWLFYEKYASRYDHTGVFLFVFPANDFREVDPARNDSTKYKPFLRTAGDGMEVYYPVAFEDRDRGGRSVGSAVKNFIDNSLYIANLARFLWRSSKEQVRRQQNLPYYDDFAEHELAAMLYALDRLALATAGRPLHVFVIPAFEDVNYVRNTSGRFRFVEELNAFAARHAHAVVVDLLPKFIEYLDSQGLPYESLTLGCDWHWGVLGNQVAAQVVMDAAYGGEVRR